MTHSFNWLLGLPLILSTYGFSRRYPADREDTVLRWFTGVVITVALASIAMVLLLTFRAMTVNYLTVAFSSIALGSLLSSLQQVQTPELRSPSLKHVVATVLILFIAIFFRLKPSSYLFGGQDPGVYMNTGNLIARHGTHFYTDTTLPLAESDPSHLNYYLKNSYYRATLQPDGSWSGNMTPGTYISDLSKGEQITQFYPITHAWLAIGSLWFGASRSTWILLPFSLLCIASVGLIVGRLSRSTSAALIASGLLAINASHAAISTSPLSEIIASFFFLSGLFFLLASIDRRKNQILILPLIVSLLCFSNLFFTRITGFVTLPLLLLSLIPLAVGQKRFTEKVKLSLFGLGCIAAFFSSFVWGLTFSGPYSRDIYRGKLRVDAEMLAILPYVISFCAVGWLLIMSITNRLTPLRVVLRKYRSWIGPLFVIVVFGILIAQGYYIAFTDSFKDHRWIGKRWDIAGHRWGSLPYLSSLVLGLLVSPAGYLIGICGLAYSFRGALTTSIWAPICILTSGFFVALTIKQSVVPYLYYFSRYQVSELLPLMVVVGTCFFHQIVCNFKDRTRLVCWSVYVVSCGLFFCQPALSRLKETEGGLFSKGLNCIDALSQGKTIIVIDKKRMPVTVLTLPLRYTFDKKTIAINPKDFNGEDKLTEFFEFYRQQGYSILFLSYPDSWRSYRSLKPIARFPMRFRKFAGDRGHLSLPYRYGGLVVPMAVYGYQPGEETGVLSSDPSSRFELPTLCKDLQ